MSISRHYFDNWTEGETIAAGIASSGFPWSYTLIPAGTTVIAEAAAAINGVRGGTATTNAAALVAGVHYGDIDTDALSFSINIIQPTLNPSAGQQRTINFYLSDSSSSTISLDLNSDGRWLVRNAARATITTASTPTGQEAPAGTKLLWQLYVKKGTTTTDGKFASKLTRLDTMAVVFDSGLLSNINTGILNLSGFRIGFPSSSWGASAFQFDDVAFDDVPATEGLLIDAYSSAADAGVDQSNVEPWTTVTLAGAGTGIWAQVSGTSVTLGGSGAVRTFTAPPSLNAQTLTFEYGGDQMTVTILPATEAVYSSGQWVPVRFIREDGV